MSANRIIPQAMRPIEKVVADAADLKAQETKEPQKTTARVENTKEGYCPICHTQMVFSTANGLDVQYCAEHSLVMPVRDQELIPSAEIRFVQ